MGRQPLGAPPPGSHPDRPELAAPRAGRQTGRRVPGREAPRRDEGRRECSRCMRRSTESTAQPAWRTWPFTSSAYGIVLTLAPIEGHIKDCARRRSDAKPLARPRRQPSIASRIGASPTGPNPRQACVRSAGTAAPENLVRAQWDGGSRHPLRFAARAADICRGQPAACPGTGTVARLPPPSPMDRRGLPGTSIPHRG